MIDDLRIRRATETDDRLLAAISYDTWPAGTPAGPLPDPAAPFFGAAGATVDNTLVAFLPETVAGFVTVAPHDGTRWAVRRVAVATPLQRRGIGLTLLRAAASAAHSAGADELVATPRDTVTGELLTQAGFVPTGEPPTMVKSPLRRARL